MYWTSIDGFNNAATTFERLAAAIQENGPSGITIDVLGLSKQFVFFFGFFFFSQNKHTHTKKNNKT